MIVFAVAGCRPAAKGPELTFYVQLVRGTDAEAPPTQASRPVGHELSRRLNCAFRWKHYWEMEQHAVVVPVGQTVVDRLSSERSVQIQLLDSSQMAVRVCSTGGAVRCRRQPVTNAFCVAGGNLGGGQSWFVVVRHDKPQTGSD